MKEIYKSEGRCPSCGSKTIIRAVLYPLPYIEGEVIIFSEKCERCGYSWKDVLSIDRDLKDVEIEYTEENRGKMFYIPPGAKISIPELGVEAEFREGFRGRITTLEGVIELVDESLREKVRGKKIIMRNVKSLSRV